MDLGRRRVLRPALIAGILLGTNGLLAAGLVAAALRPRPLIVLPAARSESELLPGAVPEEAARELALRYVLLLDNFTPATIEASTEMLKAMIAARSWAAASASLEKRRQVAIEGRMSSQSIPVSARTEGLQVTVEALRRTFISDKLSREVRVLYVVSLEKQPATGPNPYGLGVVSQTVHEP